MKKIVVIAFVATLFWSCNVDREKYDAVTIKLINKSEQILVFSNIDNGGDTRFYPTNSFTLNPHETYSQTQWNIGSYDPIVIAPSSMDIECDGKRISISFDSDIARNPCKAEDWWRYSNFSKYGPGIFFEFDIMKEDVKLWFGTE